MTTTEVCNLTGATKRQLQWWHSKGIIAPALVRGCYEYDARAVRAATIAVQLRRKGITRLELIGRILRRIGNRHGIAVISIAADMFILAPNHHLAACAAVNTCGAVIVINVEPIAHSFTDRLRELEQRMRPADYDEQHEGEQI